MKTSVEWLVEEINKLTGLTIQMDEPIIEQANKMFEQQIMDAYDEGDNNGADRIYYHSNRDDKSAEQYYKETFKSE